MLKQNDPNQRDRSGIVIGLVMVVFGLIGLGTSGGVFLLADALGNYPNPNGEKVSTPTSHASLLLFAGISTLAIAAGVLFMIVDANSSGRPK